MFHCSACKNESKEVFGRCPKCDKWQTCEKGGVKKVMLQSGEAVLINEISLEDNHRILTGTREFDRVLGDSKNLGMVQGSIVLIGGEPGQGKMGTVDTKVLTPNGWKRLGDIRVGDFVIGRSGHKTRVMKIFPHGWKNVYRVQTSDGGKTLCGLEHLWYTRTRKDRLKKRKGEVRSTAELLRTLKRCDGGLNHSIPFVEPVHFDGTEKLPLHPYVLGMYLADGNYTNGSANICKPEKDIIDKISKRLPKGDELIEISGTLGKSWRIRKNRKSKNVNQAPTLRGTPPSHTAEALIALGLRGKTHDVKFVPEIYLRANIKDRIYLLQGLLDGDGHVSTDRRKSGTTIEYSSTSPFLADQVRDLVLGLGGRCTKASRTTQFTNKHGKRIDGLLSYRLNISFHNPKIIPVSSSKHLRRFRHETRLVERYIKSIEPAGEAECLCIMVEAEDGLYVTDDYLVTHNSTLLLQVGCELAEAEVDPCKVLYVSGEETPKQVRERAERIMMIDDKAVPLTKMWFMASQKLDEIAKRVLDLDPDILIIDSLQTMKLPGEAGNMSQQENCTKFLQDLTKSRGLTTFIVSHVTKEGSLAGPKQVEHLVDVVLSFDSERGSEIRTLRALKNRFGNTEEVGIFRMTSDGLKSVDDPSEFLIRGKVGIPGSCLAALMLKPGGSGPGKRAVIFETQALLAPPSGAKGSRISQGYDTKRLQMLVAILTAHTPYNDIGSFDTYVNVTPNDFAIEEASLDLPVALALISSRIKKPISRQVVAWGEMGLTGEIRPNDYGALTRKLGIVNTMKLQTPIYSTRENVYSIQDAVGIFDDETDIEKSTGLVTDDEIRRVTSEILKKS